MIILKILSNDNFNNIQKFHHPLSKKFFLSFKRKYLNSILHFLKHSGVSPSYIFLKKECPHMAYCHFVSASLLDRIRLWRPASFYCCCWCRTSSSSHISLVSSSETGAFVPKSGLEGQGFSLLHSKAFVAAKTGVRANGTLRSGFRRLRRQQQQQ